MNARYALSEIRRRGLITLLHQRQQSLPLQGSPAADATATAEKPAVEEKKGDKEKKGGSYAFLACSSDSLSLLLLPLPQ